MTEIPKLPTSIYAVPNAALSLSEAIAGTRSENLTPDQREERGRWMAKPGPLHLSGALVDVTHPDAKRIVDLCQLRRVNVILQPGLVMQTEAGLGGQRYITFREPDETHAFEWFYEASGNGILFTSDQFEEFMTDLDKALPHYSGRSSIRVVEK